MDFFSKLTKPADHSKPASDGHEPNSTSTDSSNTDLFSSTKVVAGAAQSYFSHQPPTYENTEVAGATAEILGAASEYGKLDKTQGVGKYVDQAEDYLKDYQSSNTTTTPATTGTGTGTGTVADAGVKSAPINEATETDTATTKESSKPEPYGEKDTTEGLSSKLPSVDAPVETDTSDVYGQDKVDVLPNKTSGGGVAAETDAGDDYTQESGGGAATKKTDVCDGYQKPKVDVYEETTEEDIKKKPEAAVTDASDQGYAKDTEEGISAKPSRVGPAAEADSGDSGYTEDTKEGLTKPSAGGYAAGDGASDKVSPAEGGFGNFTKLAGDFLNK